MSLGIEKQREHQGYGSRDKQRDQTIASLVKTNNELTSELRRDAVAFGTIRTLHKPAEASGGDDFCIACSEPFPCSTYQATREISE